MITDHMKNAEIEKIHAEIALLMAQTTKLNKETRWYEMVAVSAATVAIMTAAKLLL